MVRFDKYIFDYCICFLVGLVSDIQIIYYFHITVYNYVQTIVLKTFCKCFFIFSISRPLQLIKIYNFLPLCTSLFFVFCIPTNSMKILLYVFTPLRNRRRPSKYQSDHLLFHSRMFWLECNNLRESYIIFLSWSSSLIIVSSKCYVEIDG